MPQAFLSIQHIVKQFAGHMALKDVSLDIRQGEFFSLLGPSGCGKSTLLRIIGGFERQTTGRVVIDGEDVSKLPPNRRSTNMVFQSYALFPHLTVRENVAYGLRNNGVARAERLEIAQRALETVRLATFGDRRPDQLSGGQRQRVALARAMVKKPKVLLLDEPLSALDKRLREEMQIEIRALQQKLGITFIFVTHDQEEAFAMSDRVAVMSAGSVLQVDAPWALYETPANRDVAAFIGSINFLRGDVAGQVGRRVTLQVPHVGPVDVEAATDAPLPPGASMLMAIRPEKLRMQAVSGQLDGANRLQASLTGKTYLGDRCQHMVEVPGSEIRLSISSPNEHRIEATTEIGAPIWVTWRPSDAVLLADS